MVTSISLCSATLPKCQTKQKQMPQKILTAPSPWNLEELEETTGAPSYYEDKDYPAGPENQ